MHQAIPCNGNAYVLGDGGKKLHGQLVGCIKEITEICPSLVTAISAHFFDHLDNGPAIRSNQPVRH